MKLTIATITARREPRYDRLLDGLASQATEDDELELVIVDFYGRSADELAPHPWRVPGLVQITTSSPKPNLWQGPHRATSRDLHAIANARNTALVLASYDYIAFLDDRVLLGPLWLELVRQGERRGAAICGPCDRELLGTGRAFDDRKVLCAWDRDDCGGDWFHGGNFALPLAWALEINGCEEGTDPVGRQDRVMGHMLENCGHRIDYRSGMGVLLDRKLAEPHPFPRVDKGVPPANKRTAIMTRFAKRRRTEFTPNLRQLRDQKISAGGSWPIPDLTIDYLDWYDNAKISDM